MVRQVTITLDDDVAARLEEEARRTGVTVNAAVIEALREKLSPPRPEAKPFKVHARNMGEPLIDLECTGRALEMLDELERK
jgi:hypothetical protein